MPPSVSSVSSVVVFSVTAAISRFKVSVSEAYKREDGGRLTVSDIEKVLPSETTGGKWIKRSETEWQLDNKSIAARLVEQDTVIIVRRLK
jgi:hypothetical protein